MTSELLWIYIFNVMVNSALSFATVSLFVICLLKILPIRSYRTKALLLALPFVKLATDIFMYDFTAWALMHQLNPLEAEAGSRTIGIVFVYSFFPSSIIQMLMSDGHSFTPADMIALAIEPFWVKAIVTALLTGTVLFVSTRFYHFFASYRYLRKLTSHAEPCHRSITNAPLQQRVDRLNITVVTSTAVDVPCATVNTILFPKKIVDELSKQEFDAIVAHETSHLQWYDSLTRLYCSTISTLFWWIPTRWLRKRIMKAQEYACDDTSRQYDIDSIDLASAIVKAAKAAKAANGTTSLPALACFVTQSEASQRIQRLLESPIPTRPEWWKHVIVGVIAAMLLASKYWIF